MNKPKTFTDSILTNGEIRRTLPLTEVAKKIRYALVKEFWSTKFSVKCKRYSGGSSIDVTWIDGPSSKTVQAVVDKFSGASFDGMTDSKSYHDFETIIEDGKVVHVHMGVDFVFARRDVSMMIERTEDAVKYILANCKVEGEGAAARFGNRWVSDLATSMIWDWDFERKSESLETVFRRVVLLEEE
jgi:hypothetical protein